MDITTALRAQRDEITDYHVYRRLAVRETPENRKILLDIAKDELEHYEFWKKFTKQDVKPRGVWWYVFWSRVFGMVFLLKLLEQRGQRSYAGMRIKGIQKIMDDENRHELELLSTLSEERLEYASSVVLGLNDALVELTGVLAGLTFALSNNKLIAIAGFVTGVAAALSMAASAYLSAKEEASERKHPVKVAVYTGGTYILIVLLLIAPYLLFSNIYVSLGVALAVAIIVIAFYTFYITVAKDQKFLPRFLEMALISLGVATISFILGYVLNHYYGVAV